MGVSGSFGGVGSTVGPAEALLNYNTGQVSGFVSGGIQVGWNAGASASLFTGYIWGLGSSNANYSGGFTGVSGGAVLGGYASSSSGGLTSGTAGLAPNGQVNAVGVSLLPTPTVGASATNYSLPTSLGSYWPLLNPTDLAVFLAKLLLN